MTLRIYNSLTKTKEIFKPIQEGKVGIYVCGPTVYDSAHMGHARSLVVFDVIVRFLRTIGFDVTYVRNFTDVDDKIINRSKELSISSKEVSEKYIEEFYKDTESLNIKRADIEPKATEHIVEIINFVSKLIQKGYAYVIDGDVYYSVELFKKYGSLSGRKLDDMEAGARVDIDNRKRNPFDFALWKSAKPDEPSWDSPWGKGRPGWHIECSAMSVKYLGESFDIHGGGKDLIFPHHENEIAQSEAANNKPFVTYWIHNGFVNINSEKMSKSLGNFLTIKDAVKKYHPEAIRLFLLSSHYRSPIDFTEKGLEEATVNLDRLYGFLERVKNSLKTYNEKHEIGDIWNKFCLEMDDDFNTARGISALFDAVRNLNRLMDQNTFNIDLEVSDILKIGNVIGLFNESPESYFEKKREKATVSHEIIDKLVSERNLARKSKDWKKADEIRKKLSDMNIVLEDRSNGTIWKFV
ncbi:MAG: cysteine--tRNA ligase [Desulfobacterales bacterium]|nr:cysteine--tRNA ligase [Desulfobacterales bacterium]